MNVRGDDPGRVGLAPSPLLRPVHETARTAPGQPAIVHRGTTLSYADLVRRMAATAATVKAAGARLPR